MIKKETFVEAIGLLKRQHEKDMKFADFMENEKFLDGRCIPTVSKDATKAIEILLKDAMQDAGEWIDWWIWEKDFGNNKMITAHDENGKEIKLDTAEELYDFLISNIIK